MSIYDNRTRVPEARGGRAFPAFVCAMLMHTPVTLWLFTLYERLVPTST